ncbi:MAG: galactosyltransferase-related protein [Sediminibacterium sp.]|nr:galactosyltransferase-related protein [Sediminibacterium sp.]
MNKERIYLKDITFLIPFRLDSVSRLENLNIILSYLTTYFDTNIDLLETGINSSVDYILRHDSIKYTYLYSEDQYFYHTLYNNKLLLAVTGDYVVIYDSDVIISPVQILESANLLRKDRADFVLPHNGECYNVDDFTKRMLKQKLSLQLINENKLFYYLVTKNCFGGCLFANQKKFIAAGMDNENIKGWGHEDIERIKRIHKLGLRLSCIDGPIYHLPHERPNSSFLDEQSALSSYVQYFKTCSSSPTELRNIINEWTWIHI